LPAGALAAQTGSPKNTKTSPRLRADRVCRPGDPRRGPALLSRPRAGAEAGLGSDVPRRRRRIRVDHPRVAGFAIALTVFGFSLFGDAPRDAIHLRPRNFGSGALPISPLSCRSRGKGDVSEVCGGGFGVTGIPAIRAASRFRGQPRLAEAEFRSYIRAAIIINITICVFATGKSCIRWSDARFPLLPP
jgi:hypothetical protein